MSFPWRFLRCLFAHGRVFLDLPRRSDFLSFGLQAFRHFPGSAAALVAARTHIASSFAGTRIRQPGRACISTLSWT